MKFSISASIVIAAIGIHAIVLPALYFGLNVVVSRSHLNVFVQHVRTLSRNLAEELELSDALDSQQRVLDTLDQAILNGDGDFAELVDNGREIRSSLNAPGISWQGRQDFTVGSGSGHEYFIALPISRPNHSAELRLGFDERPTFEEIQVAMRRTLWVLVGYLGAAVAVAIVWSYRLSRPVVELQHAARKIAEGDYVQTLRLRTGILELHRLGNDLEYMRGELVGVNKRLQVEMRDKQLAEERHRELEGRLRHRQRLETVGTLAGGIAHEFNNILLPIVLFAEAALAESPEHSSVHEDLQEILTQANRAKIIVDKILTFSRDAGAPALEVMDLEPVVREAIRLFSVLVPSSVEVHVNLSGPYPAVRADAAMTMQIIMNLCTNAYQSLGGVNGTVSIGLSTSSESVVEVGGSPNIGHVVLSVADSGHGMDSATVDRIFEPFFTTRGVSAGTGLGLSVVHGIATSFGATISVDSAIGRGTTFKVFFPVVLASPVVQASAAIESPNDDLG